MKYLGNLVVFVCVFLLPLSAQQIFTDVTAQMGISGQTGLGHSVGWCDIDNDGDLDVAFSNQNSDGFWLYRNDSTNFANITSQAGLSGLTAYRIIWAEVTGDTFTDLVVRTWGTGQKLYKNDGTCHFSDITGGSGISGTIVSAADFDNDRSTDLLSLTSSSCDIFYNNGSGVFTVSQLVGYANDFQCAVCFDYNLDGNNDVYLGTYGNNPNKLFKNFGNDSFVDVTSSAGVQWNGGTSGMTCGDYDNDGFSDLYLGNTSSPGCKLFHNEANGTFSDVTASAGVTGYTDTRTAAFIDYNNDGFLDIFVSNHDFYTYSNQMYRNNGNGTFTDVGAQLNLSGQMVGDYFGTAWGDFNNDGAIDLFAVGHIDKYVLFRNDNCTGNYLDVKLVGTVSNYNAIGARVQIWVGTKRLTRFVTVGEGMHDFHSLPLEFGLDNAGIVDSLTVSWPSGIVQTLYSVNANQFITIVEGASKVDDGRNKPYISGEIRLSQNHPNPFTRRTEIKYRIPKIMKMENGNFKFSQFPISLCIYDLSGRLVKSFSLFTPHSSLIVSVTWDGKDDKGAKVASGTYLYELKTGFGIKTRKLILVK